VRKYGVESTNSSVQAEVAPKLVEVDVEKFGEPIYLIQGLPSPSDTSIPQTASGRTLCIGAAEGKGMAGTEDGVGVGKRKSPLFLHS